MLSETKACKSCHRSLQGRTDKKFCNDYCRNAHHNRLNSSDNNYIRNVNHCLLRNRRILESLFPTACNMARSTRQYLSYKGFSFEHCTHWKKNKKGNLYYYCYEFGYQEREAGKLVVVRRTIQNVE
jgi:hypothetical protein